MAKAVSRRPKSVAHVADDSIDAAATHWLVDELPYLSRPLRLERDSTGKVTAVTLPAEEFTRLLNDFELALSLLRAEVDRWRTDEDTTPLEEVIARMKADGLVQD